MGCDIHAHIEVKVNGRWEHFSAPPIRRNYTLFERICGVHGELINAIAPPRGLPSDINIVTKLDADNWPTDGHSHTWLTAKEFDGLIKWEEERPLGNDMLQQHEIGYLEGNMFSERPAAYEDCRFVCWFDN